MKDVVKINDLERLRLLSDPLKLRLIQAFGERDGTVAEVAEAMGEPVTKLYRHVDALLESGLIEITRERRKRGTVERRFRTVARRFEVEKNLFSVTVNGPEDESVRALIQGAEHEILGALHESDESFIPTLARFRARVSPARFQALQEQIGALLEDIEKEETPPDDAVEIGAVIALYRMPESGSHGGQAAGSIGEDW